MVFRNFQNKHAENCHPENKKHNWENFKNNCRVLPVEENAKATNDDEQNSDDQVDDSNESAEPEVECQIKSEHENNRAGDVELLRCIDEDGSKCHHDQARYGHQPLVPAWHFFERFDCAPFQEAHDWGEEEGVAEKAAVVQNEVLFFIFFLHSFETVKLLSENCNPRGVDNCGKEHLQLDLERNVEIILVKLDEHQQS